MKSKPITRIAGTDYGSAPANQEVTVDAAGTTPAEFPRMQPVTPAKQSEYYNSALVYGAGESSQITVPGVDKIEEREKPQVGAYRRACGGKTDGSTGTDPQTGGTFKCAQAPAGQEPDETETIVTQGEDRTITIPGENWSGQLEREVKGKVLSSPETRKEVRKFKQFLPKVAKNARRDWRFASEAERKKMLEDANLSPDATKKDYIKAMKGKTQKKITQATQDILSTQATGAARGKSAGQSTYLRSEALPFAAQTRAQQIEQLKAQSKNTNNFSPSTSTSFNFTPTSTENLTKRFNFTTGQFSPSQKKADTPLFKMKGYGSNYKK